MVLVSILAPWTPVPGGAAANGKSDRMQAGFLIQLIAVVVLATLISTTASAGVFNVILNGKSIHLNSTHDWNENNFGLGIEHEFNSNSAWRTSVMANGLRDSTENMSYMVGAGLHRRLYETDLLSGFYVSAGLNAFVMTRDDVNNGNPFPGVLPSVSVGNSKFGFNLTYLPRKAVEASSNSRFVDPDLSGIVFLQFKVNVDQLLP